MDGALVSKRSERIDELLNELKAMRIHETNTIIRGRFETALFAVAALSVSINSYDSRHGTQSSIEIDARAQV